MLYWIIKPLVVVFYNIFYKIDYKGISKIPYGKPVILAPNHVNGFVDPIIIGMLMRQKVRFFARGDVFKGVVSRWFLNQFSISPMYRMQEGYAEVKKNDKTFEECRKLLSENKTILLFPEAICVQERRLRPLKKGMARIAFQAEEEFDSLKDIFIVPIGLNYTDAKRFRSKVFIDIGEAVSIKDYIENYKLDKVKTINEFTKRFELVMAEHLVIINNSENDRFVENVEEIYLDEWLRSKKVNANNGEQQYIASKEIANCINKLEMDNPQWLTLIKEKTNEYIHLLNEKKLRDHLLRPENIEGMSIGKFIKDYLIVYLGMPIYVIGRVFNYPPYYISKKISDKKAKKAEFFASIYLNLSMFLWVFYFLLELVIVALMFRNWIILFTFAIVIPVTGLFVLQYHRAMKKIFGRWRLLRMVRKDKTTVEKLVTVRMEIIRELEKLKSVDSF